MSKFKEYLEASRKNSMQSRMDFIEKKMVGRASEGKCMFCGEKATHKNEQGETTCEKCKPGKIGTWEQISEELMDEWLKDYDKKGGIADQGGSPKDYFDPISYPDKKLPESIKKFEKIKSQLLNLSDDELRQLRNKKYK